MLTVPLCTYIVNFCGLLGAEIIITELETKRHTLKKNKHLGDMIPPQEPVRAMSTTACIPEHLLVCFSTCSILPSSHLCVLLTIVTMIRRCELLACVHDKYVNMHFLHCGAYNNVATSSLSMVS